MKPGVVWIKPRETFVQGQPSARAAVLDAGLWFAQRVVYEPGVSRLALIGSILTDAHDPKDIDFLVTISDDADLAPIATLARRLKGRTQSRSRGADVFLTNETGQYLGRICSWVECRPGIRASCDALHCGRRPYLHDDLNTVTLSDDVIREPMLQLWPEVVRRCQLPSDVEEFVAQFTGPHNYGLQRTVGAPPAAGPGR